MCAKTTPKCTVHNLPINIVSWTLAGLMFISFGEKSNFGALATIQIRKQNLACRLSLESGKRQEAAWHDCVSTLPEITILGFPAPLDNDPNSSELFPRRAMRTHADIQPIRELLLTSCPLRVFSKQFHKSLAIPECNANDGFQTSTKPVISFNCIKIFDDLHKFDFWR